MKNYALILIHAACALVLLVVACSSPVKTKLKGDWHAKDGITKLKITEKKFSIDDGESIPVNYRIKGDTIYTSFDSDEPSSAFVVEKLDDHNLELVGPDDVPVDYSR